MGAAGGNFEVDKAAVFALEEDFGVVVGVAHVGGELEVGEDARYRNRPQGKSAALIFKIFFYEYAEAKTFLLRLFVFAGCNF